MADYTKIDGVAAADIAKVSSVAVGNISKVAGVSKPTTATATKWLAAGAGAKVFKSSAANAGSGWAEIVDLGSGNFKGITIGEDNSDNKRWFVHSTNNSSELHYVNDGDEDSSGNWTTLNVGNSHAAVDGGPSLAWGNDYWICATDDYGVDEIVLLASADGGTNWSEVDVGNSTNDTGRTAAYKDGTTFFMSVQDQIWKTTADPQTPGNWSLQVDLAGAQDILAMAYDGTSRWVCVGAGGEVHSSDDDWATADVRTGAHASDTIHGVVYCSGIGKWVAVGTGGKVSHSSDGATWTAVTPNPSSVTLRAIATDDTTLVAVGNSGTVITSPDAINWTVVTHSPAITNTLYAVACDIIGAGMR